MSNISRDELLFVFFLTCSLVQLFFNISKHLDNSYKIVPILSINREVRLPVVSICLTAFVDPEKFEQKYPDLVRLVGGNSSRLKQKGVRRLLYDHITLKELSLVSYSLKDILQHCYIYDNKMNRVNCSYLSPVVEWYSFEEKCFQFFAFRGQFAKRFIYNRDGLVNQEWLEFSLKKDKIRKEDIGLLVSSPNELLQPYAYNTGYIQIPSSSLATLFVVIDRFQTKRLPYPFESDCHNYTVHSISQIHCVYDCYYHQWKKQGRYPDQMLTRYPERLYGINLDKQNRTACIQQCNKKDCLIDKFELRVTYRKLTTMVPTVKIVLKNSFSEERKIVFEPLNHNKNILSLISFILSPLAFYLGNSFFLHLLFLKKQSYLCNLFPGISLYTLHLYAINVTIYLIAIFNKTKMTFLAWKSGLTT